MPKCSMIGEQLAAAKELPVRRAPELAAKLCARPGAGSKPIYGAVRGNFRPPRRLFVFQYHRITIFLAITLGRPVPRYRVVV